MFHLFFLHLAKYHKFYRNDETLGLLQLPAWKERPPFSAVPLSESPDFFLAHFTGHLLTGAETQYRFLSSVHQFPVLKGKKKGFLSSICCSVTSANLQEGKSD